ncbi:hypothetical protein RF11_03550 [Thelohanellus kitauei]|uniref:Uncharacterized protein n=1 Tax=Thelohanellus kitauei TaxID=669202 RepID=A0A0C2MXM9_THEKT|nr:hypothetical protein RF11_03550 [Thelohanellus kitauei]
MLSIIDDNINHHRSKFKGRNIRVNVAMNLAYLINYTIRQPSESHGRQMNFSSVILSTAEYHRAAAFELEENYQIQNCIFDGNSHFSTFWEVSIQISQNDCEG